MQNPQTSSSGQSVDASQLGQFIPLHYHHLMLSDKARTGAFAEAIAKVVRPGDRVLELGGGTGVLSFFAARCGGTVTYVEYNPELHDFARGTLARNGVGDSVRLVCADAATFVPTEPVDVVICEMLHSAMLREKQLNVIAAFKNNYVRAFGLPLPRFIPEVAFLAVQPLEQCFEFFGYQCPIPVFQDPATPQPATIELGDPAIYSTIDYSQEFPLHLQWDGNLRIAKGGTLNALRFVTKNIVAVITQEGRAIDWQSAYLVLPLPQPMEVEPGAMLGVRFSYAAGAPLGALADTLRVQLLPESQPVTVRVRSGLTLAASGEPDQSRR